MKWYIIMKQNNDQRIQYEAILLTNNEYKHNDMKWNIIDKYLQIWMMMMMMITKCIICNNYYHKSTTGILTAIVVNEIHMIWGKI